MCLGFYESIFIFLAGENATISRHNEHAFLGARLWERYGELFYMTTGDAVHVIGRSRAMLLLRVACLYRLVS